ncbi:MAG TPA: DHA2 family efflux MFS transporter permease subunit [Solirubrobacteraceae bacterium]|jgi:EmrB/QacA subfamily drug resistance transporter|nr:DHA2 family efflux MFS transporter permease subunit [Solirubrobacteraceae bacterium]
MAHRLRVRSGPAAGSSIEIAGELFIGREGADLTIADPDVSRRHAKVTAAGDGVIVQDLGSTNGTFIDGRRISGPTTLDHDAVLTVGASDVAVELAPRVAPSPEPVVAGAGAHTILRSAPTPEPPVAAPEPPASAEPPAPEPGAAPEEPRRRTPAFPITADNRRWWGLGATCLALAMTMFDTTVVNVALPTIERHLHATITSVEWTINAYTLSFAVFLVTGGRLGDIFGRRRMFLFGVVVFAIASAACGAATTMPMLVASRAVQGLGAGFMMPATLSIIRSTFPLPELGRAIGLWAGVSGIALAAGPLLGGILTQGISWRAVFYINMPLALLTIVVTLIAVPESRDENASRRIDFPGIVLLSATITALVLAIVQGDSWGWTSGRVLGLLGGAVLALIAFVITETRVRHPLLPLAVFRSRQFVGASTVGFTLSFSMLTVLLYTAIYMQGVLGFSAIKAGALLLPATLPIMFAGPIAHKLVMRFGFRPVMASGLVLVAAAALIQTQITASSGYLLLLPSFVLLGMGIGLSLSPTSGAAITSVPPDKAGAGAGILNMSRQVGGALGIAVTGALVESLSRKKALHLLSSFPLPATARHTIANSVATGSAPPAPAHHALSPPLLARIHQVVHASFVHGISHAMFVPLGLALVGSAAAMVLVRPPREAKRPLTPVLDHDVLMVAARSGNWMVVPAQTDPVGSAS